MNLLIVNGRVVDPSSGTDAALDVRVEHGRITDVAPRLRSGHSPVVDAAGLVVLPGLIDMHVHLREPGQEHKETIATGTRAAARGGFTSVCCMPNTAPVNDDPRVTTWIRERAVQTGLVHVFPIAALTRSLRGAEPTEMERLQAAGAIGFSDDGCCIQDRSVMHRAVATARSLGALIADHAEDTALSRNGVMQDGAVSARLGLPGIPPAAEEAMIARDIDLAEHLDASLHICHLSTAGGARLVREAKRRDLRVTAEVTPHHLLLSEEQVDGRDANFKMNPPLRSPADVRALVEAVRDGTIDVLATDHAPHATEEKAQGFVKAPFGIVGLETAVSLLLDRLVRPGLISLARWVMMSSTTPARLFGLSAKGRVAPGADADLTLIDLERSVLVEARDFASKARNTPFDGWTLTGAPVMTIVAGRVVFPFPR